MAAKLYNMSTRNSRSYPLDQFMPVTPDILPGAVQDLGMGDASETDEEKKKRLKAIEDAQSAVGMLFGPGGSGARN